MTLAFFIAITLLSLTPGVDTVLVIRNTTRGGIKDGIISSLGICSGLFVHALVSSVGISFLLLQSAWAFQSLKLMGAAYLCWLGLSSLYSAFKQNQDLKVSISGKAVFSAKRSLLEGFLSNVLNPKTIVFYMAFLPQFIDPEGSAISQSMIMAACHFLIAMTWQVLLATTVSKTQEWLANQKTRRFMDSLTGSIMVFLGVKLGFES